MKIQVTNGSGDGPTELAAFDKALVDAGIANFNLIYLSSVIPPKSTLQEGKQPLIKAAWGDRLYVVMAQHRTHIVGEEAWAGVGWMQDSQTGAGLLVEHEGTSKAQVEQDIKDSLAALAANRGATFGAISLATCGTTCTDKPVCALVAAVFESNPWSDHQ